MLRTTFVCLLASPAVASSVLAAPAPSAEATCSRDRLQANTETYMAAQTAGQPDGVVALAGGGTVTYTEDAVGRDLATGVLARAFAIDHNSSLLDTTQCATFTELIITDSRHPRVIGTQMRFDAATGRLVRMESLVTQPGDWAFNASGTLHYAAREDGQWGPIEPASDRDSRATIQAAADAYLDLFDDKTVTVPWGTPCDRLEGSMYTGRGTPTDSCDVGIPSGVKITDRRYVIDETVGAVDALVTFGTRPDSHMFRVEKGKLRFVHTLTVMRNVTKRGE